MIIKAGEVIESSSSRTLMGITRLSVGNAIPSKEQLRADDHVHKVWYLLRRGIAWAS
jgi:hypothetical protein